MFIAIEGPDGAGKSSLVSAIEAELRVQHRDAEIIKHHKGRPPEETRRCLLNEYVISLESADMFNTIHLADRWHWGERTYAPIKRPHTDTDGYGLLGKSGWRWVELFMQSRGMAQFLLYQKLDVITARVMSRGDDFIDVSELEAIYNAYNETAHVAILAETVLLGDSSFDELPGFARHIIGIARATEARSKFLRDFPQYIGSIFPKVLIVGDKRNITEKYGEETGLPFLPVATSSGDFLMSALPDDLWKHVGIVNGNEISSSDLVRLHNSLGRPPIAALGRLAEKAILRTTLHDSDYVTLPHPQFVRRFKNSAHEEYGLAIESVSKKESVGEWELQ